MPPRERENPRKPEMTATSVFDELSKRAPQFETRRALLIMNMQNDMFIKSDDLYMCEPQDFRQRTVNIVPYYRALGDIVWVTTEIQDEEPPPKPDLKSLKPDQTRNRKKGKKASSKGGAEKASPRATGSPSQVLHDTAMGYFPTSQVKASMRNTSPESREAKRAGELDDMYSDFNVDKPLSSPSQSTSVALFHHGTHGAELVDDIKACIDEKSDMIIVKHHYSALDATPLLMGLRMKLVTHIYIAGAISHTSILATAQDAVQHGFEVSVIEDCLGYRSEARHIEAMRKMADELGVYGVDSEEIMNEAGGQVPPDADEPLFSGPGLDGIQSSSRSGTKIEPSTRQPVHSSDAESATIGSEPEDALISSKPEPSLDTRRSIPEAKAAAQGTARSAKTARIRRKKQEPTLGPNDRVGDGDSRIIVNALSKLLSKDAFDKVREEVAWQAMFHRSGEVPRRVAVQGEIGADGSVPIYRHPADESPPLLNWTPIVAKIRDELQLLLKQPFNHALIQLYRSGQDFISEHSDKTLDVVRDSSIINMSLGAQRTMTIRTKKSALPETDRAENGERLTQRIPMPHNSVFVLGSKTNAKWMHAVRPDKRPPVEKSEAEKAFNGERISLTFRNIGTFTDVNRTRIWGQGAVSKLQAAAGQVSTTDSDEMEAMVTAFGKENQLSDFDWSAEYGQGFDTLNLVVANTPAPFPPMATLHLGSDELSNMRVKLAIFERDIPCRITRSRPAQSSGTQVLAPTPSPATIREDDGEDPVFRDADADASQRQGDLPILCYIFETHPPEPPSPRTLTEKQTDASLPKRASHRDEAEVHARLTQANELLFKWQALRGTPLSASTRATHQVRRPSAPPTRSVTPSTPTLAPSASRANAPTAAESAGPESAFRAELEIWEGYAEASAFAGGAAFSVVDAALWPVLDLVARGWSGWNRARYPHLARYRARVTEMECTKRAVAERGEA